MKKRIVFHLYYNRLQADNIMYVIHRHCLLRYSHLFDDAIFNIVVDDITDEAAINEAKHFVYSCGFKRENLTIIISPNTEMRDGQTFYDYVVKDLGEYDGITFFGHSKGTTNVYNQGFDIENIIYWVVAMYYFNLECLTEFENSIAIANLNPLIDNSEYISEYQIQGQPIYGYYPIGTFFSIKDKQLKEYIDENNIKIPELEKRWNAETFIGNIIPLDFRYLYSHSYRYGINMLNLYLDAKQNLKAIYGPTSVWDEYEKLCRKFIDVPNDKTVQVIYMATDKYKNYAEKFISTLHLFMPGCKKHVVILTDDTTMLQGITEKYANPDVTYEFHIMPGNCPYPCVNLSKFAYVDTFMSPGYDYVFYFDSDTYFIERQKSVWDRLKISMENDSLVMAYSTSVMNSILDRNNTYCLKLSYYRCDERPESKLYEQLGIKDDYYMWVTSSFFCGKNEIVHNFVTQANNFIVSVMKGPILDGITEYYVPRLFDETIANNMIYNFRCGIDKSIDFDVDFYLIDCEGYYSEFPNILFIQKYRTETWYKNHD